MTEEAGVELSGGHGDLWPPLVTPWPRPHLGEEFDICDLFFWPFSHGLIILRVLDIPPQLISYN